jgi:regulator of protease activity HflC (stomatin/prohibitin superfamily)
MTASCLVAAAIAFVVAVTAIKIVRPWEKGLIERLGKYERTADSGLTVIIPFVDRMVKVDMREQLVEVPPQAVVTKDNLVVKVNAVVYYEVTDPIKVTYNVADYYAAVTNLAQTNLRDLIGDMTLEESFTSRQIVSTRLQEILDDATDKWGTSVTRVELQRIEPHPEEGEGQNRKR